MKEADEQNKKDIDIVHDTLSRDVGLLTGLLWVRGERPVGVRGEKFARVGGERLVGVRGERFWVQGLEGRVFGGIWGLRA